MLKLLFNDLFRHSDFLGERRDNAQRVLIHNNLGKIVFQKTRRNRHIRISLRPDKSVLVTLPVKCSYAEADKFLCSKIEWISAAQVRVGEREARRRIYSDEETAALRLKAKVALPQRVAQLAEQHNLRFLSVSVKKMRTRWGSCSADNKLNLSIFLMDLSVELIDYVILHELCHTVHKNHGAQFWAMLNELTQGQARVLSRQIRQHTI